MDWNNTLKELDNLYVESAVVPQFAFKLNSSLKDLKKNLEIENSFKIILECFLEDSNYLLNKIEIENVFVEIPSSLLKSFINLWFKIYLTDFKSKMVKNNKIDFYILTGLLFDLRI